MGTHPIFESDFDCLTETSQYTQEMPETKKIEDKAKREEFRRYLDQAGIVDQLTQFLVSLYEEPEKPTDAVGYMKKSLGNGPDAADAEAKVVDLQSKLNEHGGTTADEAPVEEGAAAE